MSIPERLRLYRVVEVSTGKDLFITHDAGLAVQVKLLHAKSGKDTDILQAISVRRPQAINEVEVRCVECAVPHAMSIEATDDSHGIIEGICQYALERKKHHEQHRLMLEGNPEAN